MNADNPGHHVHDGDPNAKTPSQTFNDQRVNNLEVNFHGDSKHGSKTDLAQQRERALSGVDPVNGQVGRPQNASRVFQDADMQAAVREAERAYAANPQTYQKPDGRTFVDVDFGRPVGEGYSTAKGITGAHNAYEFFAEGAKRGINIVSQTPTGVPGITTIRYQVPTKNPDGSLTGGYSTTSKVKTVYDPKVISDDQMLNWGQQAALNGHAGAVSAGKSQYDAAVNGVTFRVYLNSENSLHIENFHPK